MTTSSLPNAGESVVGARAAGFQQAMSISTTPDYTETGDDSSQAVEAAQDDHGTSTSEIRKAAWKGWAELENEPLIFTQILRDMGILNVCVDEVIPLDSIFEKSSESVLGLIFLSRWTTPSNAGEIMEPPQDLWFANQISTFSCATLALMNIINNRSDLDLGPALNEFKQSTMPLQPKDRGLALDDFQFVKDIHNSFARELDHLIVDLHLKEEVQAATKKRASRKKKKTGKKRKKTSEIDDENGLHFVAYVASHGHVWKLDGLEASPRQLGTLQDGDDWLMATIADIQTQLEDAEANAMEFSLLSLTHKPDAGLTNEDETKIRRMKEDWCPFIAHMIRLHAEKGDLESLLK